MKIFEGLFNLRNLLALILGAAGGYLYYHFWGCEGGCKITGNPYMTTIYGAVVGLTLFFQKTKTTTD